MGLATRALRIRWLGGWAGSALLGNGRGRAAAGEVTRARKNIHQKEGILVEKSILSALPIG